MERPLTDEELRWTKNPELLSPASWSTDWSQLCCGAFFSLFARTSGSAEHTDRCDYWDGLRCNCT
jgi:hypothetical protein